MFKVAVKELVVRLQQQEQLEVFPMTQTPLTTDHLLVTTSDRVHRRNINYVVKNAPHLGRLLFLKDNGRVVSNIRNFTQKQVNESRIIYEHNRPFSNITVFDSISLEAGADYASRRLDLVLNIRISVASNDGIEKFVASQNLVLEEGGSAIVHTKNLNTSGILNFIRKHRGYDNPNVQAPMLRLQVTELPKHGVLTISKEKARVGQYLTQMDIDRGFVAYFHDDSDTSADTYGMAVYLEGDKSEKYGDGRGQTGDILLFDRLWNISIVAVNDRPFRLRTDSPSMTVVQRQAKAISRDMLLTEDMDTPPTDLLYVVVNSPTQGRLVFAENITRPVKRFSQDDVNQKRVIYFHDGDGDSLKPDDFYFRVSDGQYKPVYRHFRIHIIPLELKLDNKSAIEIQQGTRMAYVTSANIGSRTNGQRSFTYFNITEGPRGGQLYLNDAPASMFSQINIDNEEVVFMQSDMSFSNDSFTTTVTNQDAVLYDQTFRISVTPLTKTFKTFECNVLEGKAPILRQHLDATQLAGLTNSNPVYFLQTSPQFGRIMRIVRPSTSVSTKKSLRDKEVWQFTHEDVKNGVIHYVVDEEFLQKINGVSSSDGISSLNDSFTYRLVAPGVQPANGVFDFVVRFPVSFFLPPISLNTVRLSNHAFDDCTTVVYFLNHFLEWQQQMVPYVSLLPSLTFIWMIFLSSYVFVVSEN